MSQIAKMSTGVKTPKKAAKPKPLAKAKKAAAHPPYLEMVADAIKDIGNRGGASRIAIKKHILANYRLGDTKATNTNINLALRRGLKSETLFTNRFHGGHFKIVKKDKKSEAKKSPTKDAAKKAVVKKSASKVKSSASKEKKTAPKKSAIKEKKSDGKKAETPKKAIEKVKTPKKTPAKKAMKAKPKLSAKKPVVKKVGRPAKK